MKVVKSLPMNWLKGMPTNVNTDSGVSSGIRNIHDKFTTPEYIVLTVVGEGPPSSIGWLLASSMVISFISMRWS